MKRITVRLLATVFLVAVGGVITTVTAHAGITFTAEAPGVQATTVAGAVTETFDAVPLGIIGNYESSTIGGTFAGGAVIVADQYGGAGGAGQYDNIGSRGPSTTPQTLVFSSGQAFFGFWWSAMDEGNTVEFLDASDASLGSFNADGVIASLSLSSGYLGNPSTGQQSGHYFAYVNFIATDGDLIDKVVFRGTNFETDNHAVVRVAVVPEPTTFALLGLGLAGIATSLRRKHCMTATAQCCLTLCSRRASE